MVTAKTLLKHLPPYLNREEVVKWGQSTKDIVKEIILAHERHENEYDEIYHHFDTGNIYTTCEGLFDFCKANMQYQAEPDEDQTVKSPSVILQQGDTVDCKHYSLFIGGVLDAIQQNEDVDWDWFYRFAGYNGKKEVYHVFVVVEQADGKEIWIDPVLDYFNERKYPTYTIDKKPMSGIGKLSRLSGIGDTAPIVEVDSRAAEMQALVLLNVNYDGVKDLFNRNPQIVNGPVKAYYKANNMDFAQLLNILNMPNLS